jgi:hypothetical protein
MDFDGDFALQTRVARAIVGGIVNNIGWNYAWTDICAYVRAIGD